MTTKTEQTVTYRPACEADIPTLCYLWATAAKTDWPDEPQPDLAQQAAFADYLIKLLAMPSDGLGTVQKAIIAESESHETVGAIIGMVFDRPYGLPARVLNVAHWFVLPNRRGSGIGAGLDRELLAWAKAQGAEAVVRDWPIRIDSIMHDMAKWNIRGYQPKFVIMESRMLEG